ncbi:MAG: glycosyltransferase [Bacteroidetes bacterium]|nr:MAG: glycosyltransferase [Bacteroidota bacterium]
MICVWDCGPDNSWEVICELQRQHPGQVLGIHLSRNFGQHNALICGFQYARGEFVITMDEDLQHRPADIAKLIAVQQQADYDLVYGSYRAQAHGWLRSTTSSLLRRMLRWGIPELPPHYSPFRLIKTEIARQTTQMNNAYTFLDGYLSWLTSHVGNAPVSHLPRAGGKSAYTFRKLIEHSVNIFITFSRLPIRLFSWAAFGVFLLSTLYSLYVLLRKLVYNDFISGFATIAIFLGMGFGLVLLGLGILGEYLYRINLKTTRRPSFFVREIRSGKQRPPIPPPEEPSKGL